MFIILGWLDELIVIFDHAVYLHLPTVLNHNSITFPYHLKHSQFHVPMTLCQSFVDLANMWPTFMQRL